MGNVGDGENYGLELAGDTQVGERLTLGGNFTWLHRRIVDPLQPALRPVGTPKIQSLLFRNAEKTNVNAEPAPAAEKTKKEGK